MRFVTELAIRRRVVTVLSVALLLAFGVFTYRNMPEELFPEIEFPLITVTAIYTSAGPDAVVRNATVPIETAMLGIDGIDSVQSVSSGFLSVVSGSFEFGTDMAKAEQALNASLDAIDFPSAVEPPNAARVTPDAFPVLQLGLSANGDVSELQGVVESSAAPAIAGVDVVPMGRPGDVADVDGLKRLTIEGPTGTAPLGQIAGGRTRLRPILITAIAASFALLHLVTFVSGAGGIISAELAAVVKGCLITSTALTLIVVPVVYMLVNETIPGLFSRGSDRPALVEAS